MIASKAQKGIERSSKIGIVAYGTGEAVIRHDAGHSTAVVTIHLAGESPQTRRIPLENRLLRVPLRDRLENGAIVEWIEVDFREPLNLGQYVTAFCSPHQQFDKEPYGQIASYNMVHRVRLKDKQGTMAFLYGWTLTECAWQKTQSLSVPGLPA